MNLLEALISHTPGQSAPDNFEIGSGRPSSEFVVTRNVDGSALSKYGDLVWDRRPYASGSESSILNFNYGPGQPDNERLKNIDEMHWLVFIAIYLNPRRRSLSNGTLNLVMNALRMTAKNAEASGFAFDDREEQCADPRNDFKHASDAWACDYRL